MKFNPLIVIPLYNHASTVSGVAKGVLSLYKNVLVVDDGSADGGLDKISSLPINIIKFKKNQGKGAAIISAASWAKNNGFTHILTIDADGQHFPADIEKLLIAAKEQSSSIIIGKRNFDGETIPKASKFGRSFSGFWARVQTGQNIADIQSGFRVYPVDVFDKYKIFSKRFAFEVEIIIKAIWAGFDVKEVEVGVHYPKNRAERVSHFSFIKDNARLSVLNTYLTIRSMLPIAHRKFVKNEKGDIVSINPFKVVAEQLKSDGNPFHLGISAAWGSFWGALALPGIRNFILMVGVGWFNLNRAVSFSVDKLAMPPFIPFVCIEIGYFLRHGKFLTEVSWQTIGQQFLQRVLEWILGSLIVAPIFALIVGSVVFTIGHIMKIGAKKYL
ncbi:MAG: glycosyltransferase family 2 protein [Endomicrobium sp.]|jgi:glycosyltransferase involved in cell wall biosynthesis|nr:glycosyltransferase family 2 protein [Endomicrobium sp.]